MQLLNLENEPMSAIVAERNRRERKSRRRFSRSYETARHSRLTSDWLTSPTATANYEIRLSLRNLRARSRDLVRNNDYVKKFLSLVRSNVVGAKGITCQVRFSGQQTPREVEAAREIQQKFAEWSKKENCTLSNKLTFLECQRLFINTLARDGEVLVRKVFTDKNKFGFALKFIDVNWLDENYNEELRNGNRVIMSVEVDQDERAVAYHLTPPRTFLDNPRRQQTERTRVPAEEIIHAFLINEDETQTRGVPWIHTAIMRLRMHFGAEEAELVAYRVGASKMGFYIPPKDDFGDGELAEGEESGGIELAQTASPASFEILEPGYDFKTFDPKFPEQAANDFCKRILRGIAAGLGVEYHNLSGDLEGVNYSSARIGELAERDMWRVLQQFTIDNFCQPVFKEWLYSAILSGQVKLSAKDFDRVAEPQWRARGWAWTDPMKDINASVTALQNGLTTHTDVLAEQGKDFVEILETKKHEQELMKQYGVELIVQPAQKAAPEKSEGEADSKDDAEEKPAEKSKDED